VAVVALFVAVRAYVWRVLFGTAQRRCALILARFYVAPAAALADYLDLMGTDRLQVIGWEMWPGLYLWVIPFTAIAVAALAGALLACERDRRRDASVRGRHCWVWSARGSSRGRAPPSWRSDRVGDHPVATQPAPPTGAVGGDDVGHSRPSLLLRPVESSRHVVGTGRRSQPHGLFRWSRLGFTLAPLALPAALAYARPTRVFQGVVVRVWAPAPIAIYGFIGITGVGTFPPHALQGLSIPFAVLAVAGVSTVRPRLRPAAKLAIGAFLVALLTVPPLARELNRAKTLATARDPIAIVFGAAGAFVTVRERDAFDYLERAPDRGGVLASRRSDRWCRRKPADTRGAAWGPGHRTSIGGRALQKPS
jgi:hypothetical protein